MAERRGLSKAEQARRPARARTGGGKPASSGTSSRTRKGTVPVEPEKKEAPVTDPEPTASQGNPAVTPQMADISDLNASTDGKPDPETDGPDYSVDEGENGDDPVAVAEAPAQTNTGEAGMDAVPWEGMPAVPPISAYHDQVIGIARVVDVERGDIETPEGTRIRVGKSLAGRLQAQLTKHPGKFVTAKVKKSTKRTLLEAPSPADHAAYLATLRARKTN